MMVMLAAVLGAICLLGSVWSMYFMKKYTTASLKRMPDGTDKASRILVDNGGSDFIPSWMFISMVEISGMMFISAGILSYTADPEYSAVIGCWMYFVGCPLCFVPARKEAKKLQHSSLVVRLSNACRSVLLMQTIELLNKDLLDKKLKAKQQWSYSGQQSLKDLHFIRSLPREASIEHCLLIGGT